MLVKFYKFKQGQYVVEDDENFLYEKTMTKSEIRKLPLDLRHAVLSPTEYFNVHMESDNPRIFMSSKFITIKK